jgi:hypothetical protein
MVPNHPNRSGAAVTPEDLIGRYRAGQRDFAGVDLRDASLHGVTQCEEQGEAPAL